MLYLNPPFYFINGVMVYRDHADSLQFYYMPLAPRLRRVKDGATGRMIPQFQLIKFRSERIGGGGFANFDVHVGLEPEELDDLASELRSLARLGAAPRLSPVPVIDGSVRLLLFGAQTPPTDAPQPDPLAPPPEKPVFVLKISHAAKPSLYGDNQAAFSVRLDEEGTTILEKAMQGEMSPIGIVYSLDYLALRPGFSVRLNVDWDRVQKHMDESFGNEGMFTSIEIGKAVDELIESRAVEMTADNFVADAEDDGATAGRFEAARTRVQDMITDAFFASSLPPATKEPDGWDKAKDVLRTLQRPMSPWGVFSYKKHEYTRIDKKRLDVTMSERTTVKRTIWPQGHLAGLFGVLRDGEDPRRFVLDVDADHPWFKKRTVRVINRADMGADGIASIQAVLRYGATSHDFVFDKNDGEETAQWLSIVENGAVKPDVTVDYTVNFKDAIRTERPLSLTSKPRVVTTDALELHPRELYSIVHVPVTAADNFPWARYPQVEVHLRYNDAANGITMDDRKLLSQNSKSAEWPLFVLDAARQTFDYRLVYRAANNADVETPWTSTDNEFVDVRDPFPAQNRLRVDVVPVVARWDDVEQMFVDLRYEDAANGFVHEESLMFGPADKAAKPFVVDLRDPARRVVSFRVTTVLKGGVVLEVPRSYTESTRVLVIPDMRGHRLVSLKPPADFRERGLDRIVVDLMFKDAGGRADVTDQIEFRAPGGRQTFEFDYSDAQHDRWSWAATYVFANGLTRRIDFAESDADELVLPSP